MQDINPGRIPRLDSQILLFSKHIFGHSQEIDDRNGQRSVHVEDDASEARTGRRVGNSDVAGGSMPLISFSVLFLAGAMDLVMKGGGRNLVMKVEEEIDLCERESGCDE
ncbi:unnamed protein product [Rhodiola kirilowii]